VLSFEPTMASVAALRSRRNVDLLFLAQIERTEARDAVVEGFRHKSRSSFRDGLGLRVQWRRSSTDDGRRNRLAVASDAQRCQRAEAARFGLLRE
jgi:hypothetical protein